jgi:WhiB family redox-sensing transcriptional regulator
MTAGAARAAASPPPGRSLADDPRAAAVLELAPLLDAAELTWADRALCAEVDPEIFFPEKGGSTLQPKRVCRACPVRAECLDWALEHGERFGIWGGLSERERRPLERQYVNQPGRAA